jgi:phosphohistidine phosphatase
MHRLILMRHAKAERGSPSGRDQDRPLAARGREDAARVGKALASRGLKPDRALVSGAVRTRQTWDIVHDSLGDVEVAIVDDLYEADAEILRASIEAEMDTAGCLILIGHNPGIHQLAVELLMEGAAAPSVLDRLSSGFPTGMAAIFSIDAAERHTLEGLIRPDDAEAAA